MIIKRVTLNNGKKAVTQNTSMLKNGSKTKKQVMQKKTPNQKKSKPVFSEFHFGKNNEKAIFTVAIPNHIPEYDQKTIFKYSLETIVKYAKRIGADLIIQNRPNIKHKLHTNQMEKFNIKKFLEKYRRVLYLDCDILITKNAPDIFEAYPDPDKVYMLNEVNYKKWDDRLRELSKKLGRDFSFWYKTGKYCSYYNSGVMLLSNKHKDVFTIGQDYFSHWCDQTYINYQMMKNNIPIIELDSRYNSLKILGLDTKKGYFLHYAGVKEKRDLLAEYRNKHSRF